MRCASGMRCCAQSRGRVSTESWVVTGTVVAIALATLGYWATDVLTAVHNIQLTTNTPGSRRTCKELIASACIGAVTPPR